MVAAFVTSWCSHCDGVEHLLKQADRHVRQFLKALTNGSDAEVRARELPGVDKGRKVEEPRRMFFLPEVQARLALTAPCLESCA